MTCGDDSMIVSRMRSLFARSEEPVSVTSTIASTKSGTFTSVAPQENSTSAVTPWLARKRRVISTASVAMTLPCRSFTLRMSEASGAAMTQRGGCGGRGGGGRPGGGGGRGVGKNFVRGGGAGGRGFFSPRGGGGGPKS